MGIKLIKISCKPLTEALNCQLAMLLTIYWPYTNFLTRPSTRLPTRLPTCLPTCLPACLPACLPVCLSVCLSVCLCLCLPVYNYCLRAYLSMPTHLYLPSVPTCLCLPVYTYLFIIWGKGQPNRRLCLI